MRRISTMLVLVVSVASVWMCAVLHAEGDERLVVIVHPTAPMQSISHAELEAVFTLTRRRWSNGQGIVVVNLEAGTPARTYFDRIALGMTPDQAARFWIDRRIRDGRSAPIRAPSAPVMLRVIASLPQSIGYIPEMQLGPGVRVVARIAGGRVLPEGQGVAR